MALVLRRDLRTVVDVIGDHTGYEPTVHYINGIVYQVSSETLTTLCIQELLDKRNLDIDVLL